MIKYKQEKEMYPDVCQWLEQFLKSRFQRATIEVCNLSESSLSRFLTTHNMGDLSPEWVTWDIKVDVVGFIQRPNRLTSLAFVECKIVRLTIEHLSQLLGYSRIAIPVFSFLISPLGLSPKLISLLQEYRRLDVLEYHWEKGKRPRRVVVAQWDTIARNLNWQNAIGGTEL
ncbi:hypothetical protein FJZ31_03530 [Candidatus Poribacteria bacterium]|nr:hypothetical protein [Candidatus Poribacteria bacterium]